MSACCNYTAGRSFTTSTTFRNAVQSLHHQLLSSRSYQHTILTERVTTGLMPFWSQEQRHLRRVRALLRSGRRAHHRREPQALSVFLTTADVEHPMHLQSCSMRMQSTTNSTELRLHLKRMRCIQLAKGIRQCCCRMCRLPNSKLCSRRCPPALGHS